MDFAESEDLRMYRDSIRKFLDKECPVEKIAAWDKADTIPRDLIHKMADLGILGLTVPEEYGGMGRQVLAMSVLMEEMSARWTAIAGLYNMSVAYGSLNFVSKGTEEQKREFLPKLLAGDILFAYGLSEPDVGGDLASVKTRAERKGGKVIVNGSKRWTSGAHFADYIMALVRSDDPAKRYKNLSFIILPTDAKGVSIQQTKCMGTGGNSTCDVQIENVELDESMIMGGEAGWNNGWSMLAGPALEIEKLGPTMIALGTARGALEEAWAYSQQRVQGGKRICGHQAVRHVLSEAQTQWKACQLMAYNAAWKVEMEMPSAVDTSMAKLFVSEAGKKITLDCQQYVMGAYGYAEGFQMERFVRDILAVPIYGGSSAIQRNNIANLMKLPRE
jgi:alkylation response protein AidB-like acyl-CoA dehydrogenase